MKTQFSRVMKRCVGGAVLAATLAAVPAGWGQVQFVNNSASMPGLSDLGTYSTVVNPIDSMPLNANGFNFKLTSAVYKEVQTNPFGDGLVFAYKIENVSAPVLLDALDPNNSQNLLSRAWGITSFSISGFGGFSVAVDESTDGFVPPGATELSVNGATVKFTYPPWVDPGEVPGPPIYPTSYSLTVPYTPGYSNTLYVFTNATDYAPVFADVTNEAIFNWGTSSEFLDSSLPPEIRAVATFAPKSVPDSASTSGLIGLALVLLAAGFRMRASSRG